MTHQLAVTFLAGIVLGIILGILLMGALIRTAEIE